MYRAFYSEFDATYVFKFFMLSTHHHPNGSPSHLICISQSIDNVVMEVGNLA